MNRINLSLIALFLILSLNLAAQHEHHNGCIHSKGYAVMDTKSPLVPYNFERRAVGDNDILIDILYSGVCHSDIHTVRGDWGNQPCPLVPGHEIVGRVSKVGKNVQNFKIGDIAGVGCMVNSCGECQYCLAGEEQFCDGKEGAIYTYGSYEGKTYTQGGYSTNIVVKEPFAIKIPQNAPLEKVAPLLCAGITTYSPLMYNKAKAGDKVAVAGFGGLGHMALQYAISMGADVTVFDISEEKRQAALDMGATNYVNVTNKEEMDGMYNTFDLILSSIPFSFQIEEYLHKLKADGTMVLLGVQAGNETPSFNSAALRWRKKIYSSLIGGIKETQEMIDYSVKNNIYPKVEIIPIQNINEAYDKVLDGKVLFRYVIDMSTLK